MRTSRAYKFARLNRYRGPVVKGLLVAIVCAAALWAMELGVGFSERPGTIDSSYMLRIYDTIGLFVLGGLDLGEPIGGPVHGRVLMWFAYFGAPALTGIAVVETLIKTVAPTHWHFRKIRNHTVIIGAGTIGEIYMARLRALYPRCQIIIVEPERDLAEGSAIASKEGPIYVHGDVHSEVFMNRLRFENADRVVIATNDDFVNLDVATRVLEKAPDLGTRILIHVSDLSLLRAVQSTRVAKDCTIFNTYHVAAKHLVHAELLEWFQHTIEDDIVVLGGFGRFGQTVLAELQDLAGDRFNKVIIVDPRAKEMAALFDAQVGFQQDKYDHYLLEFDLDSPQLWREIEERFSLKSHTPAFVLGSSSDATNLRSAMHLQTLYKETRSFARVFENSTFAAELAKDTGVRIISMAALFAESMPKSWFSLPSQSSQPS